MLLTESIKKEEVTKLYWEEGLGISEIAWSLGVSFWTVYRFMNKSGIPRRDRSLAAYGSNSNKPRFQQKTCLEVSDNMLKIAGIMLYWAEGTLHHNTVDFTNSNPEMIKVFLKFLREICGVKEERLRVYLYAYEHQDIESLKLYWHRTTRIPLTQFTKPYIRKNNLNVSQRKLRYGVVHIRYNDKKLLALITSWIKEYVQWVGTQVAKGDRLSQAASC